MKSYRRMLVYLSVFVYLSWAKIYFFPNSTKWFIILTPRWSSTGKKWWRDQYYTVQSSRSHELCATEKPSSNKSANWTYKPRLWKTPPVGFVGCFMCHTDWDVTDFTLRTGWSLTSCFAPLEQFHCHSPLDTLFPLMLITHTLEPSQLLSFPALMSEI